MRNRMSKLTVGSVDLSGGFVSARPAHQLEEGQASVIKNVDLFTNFGAVTARKGSAYLIRTALTDAASVANGIYQFNKSDGTSVYYMAHGKSIYEVAAPTTATARYTDADDLGSVNFTTFEDKCIAVSPTMPMEYTTGTGVNFAALTGSPPANGKYIESHKNRVFEVTTTLPSRMYYCVQGDAEDWTTLTGADTDSGFIDIGGDDGDIITGLASLGNVMVIFKRNSTWILGGSHANNFTVRPASTLIGCIAPRSIIKCDQFVMFLSDLGVYSLTANGNGIVRMSYNVQPTIDAYSRARREAAVAGRYKTQYWLTFPVVSVLPSTIETLVLDYVFGSWSKYSHYRALCYLTDKDGSLLMQPIGNFDNHDIITCNTGNTDDTDASGAGTSAEAIEWEWRSKEYDFGLFVATKVINDVTVVAGPLSGGQISITPYLNGIQQATFAFSLTPVSTETKVMYKTGAHPPDTCQKNFIAYDFLGTSSTGQAILYGYSIVADMFERESG